MTHSPQITCPLCGKQDTWQPENAFKPFCSKRCKLIDLGEWASETRKIPGAPIDPFSFRDNDGPEDFREE